jgi:hypothetical protein
LSVKQRPKSNTGKNRTNRKLLCPEVVSPTECKYLEIPVELTSFFRLFFERMKQPNLWYTKEDYQRAYLYFSQIEASLFYCNNNIEELKNHITLTATDVITAINNNRDTTAAKLDDVIAAMPAGGAYDDTDVIAKLNDVIAAIPAGYNDFNVLNKLNNVIAAIPAGYDDTNVRNKLNEVRDMQTETRDAVHVSNDYTFRISASHMYGKNLDGSDENTMLGDIRDCVCGTGSSGFDKLRETANINTDVPSEYNEFGRRQPKVAPLTDDEALTMTTTLDEMKCKRCRAIVEDWKVSISVLYDHYKSVGQADVTAVLGTPIFIRNAPRVDRLAKTAPTAGGTLARSGQLISRGALAAIVVATTIFTNIVKADLDRDLQNAEPLLVQALFNSSTPAEMKSNFDLQLEYSGVGWLPQKIGKHFMPQALVNLIAVGWQGEEQELERYLGTGCA